MLIDVLDLPAARPAVAQWTTRSSPRRVGESARMHGRQAHGENPDEWSEQERRQISDLIHED